MSGRRSGLRGLPGRAADTVAHVDPQGGGPGYAPALRPGAIPAHDGSRDIAGDAAPPRIENAHFVGVLVVSGLKAEVVAGSVAGLRQPAAAVLDDKGCRTARRHVDAGGCK